MTAEENKDRRYDDPPSCPKCESKERHRLGRQRRLFYKLKVNDEFEDTFVYLRKYRYGRLPPTCDSAFRFRVYGPDIASEVVDKHLSDGSFHHPSLRGSAVDERNLFLVWKE